MGNDTLDGEVTGWGEFEILASSSRQILTVDAVPRLESLQDLLGVRAGGQSRAAIEALLTKNDSISMPIHLLLDDFAGASLVAGWAWSRWLDDWDQRAQSSSTGSNLPKMEGICAGFRQGASSLTEHGRPRHDIQSSAFVSPLTNPADPGGWHASEFQGGAGMRRARWIDIWGDAGALHIRTGFQDSATDPVGDRVAIHEYLVSATADVRANVLTTLAADPRILPYRECPAAAGNISRMIGQPLAMFRSKVLAELPGTLGCTHLNDVLRALADIPYLHLMLQRHNFGAC